MSEAVFFDERKNCLESFINFGWRKKKRKLYIKVLLFLNLT